VAEVHGYVCSHVFLAARPILLVAREEGDWMFLCGEPHGADEEYHLVGIKHLVERDGTLVEVRDLEDNSEAERDEVGGRWIRTAIKADMQ
jgi:hypothetical protein